MKVTFFNGSTSTTVTTAPQIISGSVDPAVLESVVVAKINDSGLAGRVTALEQAPPIAITDVTGLDAALNAIQQRLDDLEAGGGVEPAPVAPVFTAQPSLTGSTALGSTITINLGAASGTPVPALSGLLTRPGQAAVAVADQDTFTVTETDQGGTITLDATATNSAGSVTATASLAVPAEPVEPDQGTWSINDAAYVEPFIATGGASFRSIDFSDDGLKFYTLNRFNSYVTQWTLTTPFDVTSRLATADGTYPFETIILAGTYGQAVAHGYFMGTGGTLAWIWNRQEVWEFSLSTPFDMLTATQTGYKHLAEVVRGHDIDWSPDGTIFYVDDRNNGSVKQYSAGTPWDVETLTYQWQYVLPLNGEVRGVQLNPSGTRMFTTHSTAMLIREYELTVPRDVRSAALIHGIDLSPWLSDPVNLLFVPDGSKFLIVSEQTKKVHIFLSGSDTAEPPPPEREMTFVPTADGLTIEYPTIPASLPVETLTSDGIILGD